MRTVVESNNVGCTYAYECEYEQTGWDCFIFQHLEFFADEQDAKNAYDNMAKDPYVNELVLDRSGEDEWCVSYLF